MLLYFFIGVIICIVVWKGFDAVRERYWMDELDAGSQKFLMALEKENQGGAKKINAELQADERQQLPDQGYRPP